MLRIKDIEFEVDRQRSSVSAYIPQQPQDPPERLCWSIEVECVEKDYERGFWVPKLYAQDISIKIRDWRRLEGEEVREGGDRLAAYLYVQEHERTRRNSIRFSARRGSLFSIEWSCEADVYWDDEYSAGLPLRLNTEIAFDGIHVSWLKADAEGLALAKKMVKRYMDLSSLQEPQSIGPYHIVFRPV